jgi:hypothetical protein
MLEYGREDFELLELSILREMFDLQFRKFGKRDADTSALNFKIDTDRVIDDFIFFCMLVGNDFLPHCPHLSIDSGALSLMLKIYTDSLQKMGGYLTKGEKIHPERFQVRMGINQSSAAATTLWRREWPQKAPTLTNSLTQLFPRLASLAAVLHRPNHAAREIVLRVQGRRGGGQKVGSRRLRRVLLQVRMDKIETVLATCL